MALRVLLADESVTIKKVFQLALQDFAVEVNTVNVGLDVVQVALKTKPDIIFADVLLQKLNGYDVSRDVKANPQLANIPVVLIWSGFMELDEARFKSCGASAHLEKPFDTQILRKIVQGLVPKTNTQPLSEFLNFPKLPEFTDEAPAQNHAQTANASSAATAPVSKATTSVARPPAASTPNMNLQSPPPFPIPTQKNAAPINAPQQTSAPTPPQREWSMENFENIEHTHFPPVPAQPNEDVHEEFIAVQLPSEPPKPKMPSKMMSEKPAEKEDDGGGQWVQKTLTNFKLAPEKRTDETPTVKYKVPQEKINPDEFISNTWSGRSSSQKLNLETSKKAMPPEMQSAPPPLQLEAENDQEFELDLGDTKSSSTSSLAKEAKMSDKQIEAIVREQAKEIIEKVVWQVVPEIATRIIERELERLMKERNSL